MPPWQPDRALDRLTAALEAESLAAPEVEVQAHTWETTAMSSLPDLRAFLAHAVAAAVEATALPPEARDAPAPLRRS